MKYKVWKSALSLTTLRIALAVNASQQWKNRLIHSSFVA